jgi:GNAT superfamily N-acetyltransferase
MDIQKLQKTDKFEGTIRPIDISKDVQNLANFFNSIDDLWPGTFTKGIKYTEKLANEFIEKRNALVTLVAFDLENRLVGFCSIHKRMEEKNVSFIGILGAHPDVLSKKYGKYLLLRAVDFCVANGDVRLDLGTWASNMKAVPLYKKIGFQWVPKTSVNMQNYIPAILKDQFCKSFFNKHPDWYLNQKREISQAPDDLKINGIHVFKYNFEVGDDFLQVSVDQYSRAISGITRMLDGELLSITLSPQQHKVFSGLEEELTLEINNETDQELNLITSFEGSKECFIKENQIIKTIPKGISRINNVFTIDSTAPDSKQFRKTPSIRVRINLGGEFIILESGMKNQQLVDIYRHNDNVWLPSGSQVIPINLQNRSNEPLSGNLLVWTKSPHVTIHSKLIPIEFTEEENIGINVPILINDISSDHFVTLFCQINGKNKKSRVFEVPVFISNNPSLSIGVIRDQKIIDLRNNFLKCKIHLEGARVTLFSPNRSAMGIGVTTFDYGPPFGFSEFNQVEFDFAINEKVNEIEIRLSKPSQSKSNLIFHRIFSLRAADSHVCIWDEVENTGTLDDKTTTIIQPHFTQGVGGPIGQLYLVHDGKLLTGPNFIWPAGKGDLLEGHDKYEPWIYIQNDDISYYHIYETDNIFYDPSRNQIGTIEKTIMIPKLSSGKSAKSWIGMGNLTWKEVRTKSYFLSLKKNIPLELLDVNPTNYIEISIPLEQRVITNHKFKIKISLKSYRLMPNGGKLMIKPPKGWLISPTELDITELNLLKPYDFEIEGNLSSNATYGTYNLEFVFESSARLEMRRIPFLVITDQTIPKQTELPLIDDKSATSLENNSLKVHSSKDFIGSIIKISYNEIDYLTSNFPNYKPSLFFSQDPGGLYVVPLGRNDDLDDLVFLKEKYTSNLISSSSWTGIEYSVNLNKRKSLKGLKMNFTYEILGGNAGIIRFRQKFHNPTSAIQEVLTFTLMSVAIDGNIEKVVSNIPSKELTSYQFFRENPLPVGGMGSEKLNHLTFTKGDRKFSIVRSKNPLNKIVFFDIGQMILAGFFTYWTIEPNQTKEVSNFLVIDKISDEFLDDIRQIFSG